jgi:predicted SprT family Zn-dependent metalloprotease
MFFGVSMLNVDYLPILLKDGELKKYLQNDKEMNLMKRDWEFQYGSSRSWAGMCDVGETTKGKSEKKNIYISIEFTRGDANWKENMNPTIMHEISHAIVREMFYFSEHFKMSDLDRIDPDNKALKGHGTIWKKVCKAISGDDCQMYYRDFVETDFFKPFKYSCSYCGNEKYGNSRFFASRCSNCQKPILITDNVKIKK